MIKIGEFSKLARISVRMLRHYEKIELLIPAKVDEVTGYRFYTVEQLSKVNKIILLKDMGFSLNEIRDILFDINNKKVLKEKILKQKEVVELEKNNIDNRLLILENVINELERKTDIMEYSVVTKDMPKRYVASVRQIIDTYQDEGKLWHVLMEELNKKNVKFSNQTYALAIFHDKEYREADVDVEVQISVEGEYQDTNKVKFKIVEPFFIASTIIKGDYSQFNAAMEALLTWINNNNYEIMAGSFSINHVSPNDDSNPNNWVTELCMPIKRK